MIELSRSKKTYLGKTQDGRNKWSLDCSIAPIVMRELGKDWEDIKPEFVIEGNKRISKGTPYRLEIDTQGNRRIYPDRTDCTKYLDFSAIPSFAGLSKKWESNHCVAKTANEDFVFGIGHSASFKVLFRSKPAFNKIVFNVDSVGFNVAELLKPDSIPRIPRPKIIDSSPEPIERWLDWKWSKANKQLTLDLDFANLVFPVLLKNTTITPDPIIGASEDDAQEWVYTHQVFTDTDALNVESGNEEQRYWTGFRFVSEEFPTSGSTIDSCYIGLVKRYYTDMYSNIHFQLAESPPSFTATNYDISSRTRTTASVSWVAYGLGDGRHNSPSLCVPAQELWDSYSPTALVVIFRPNTDEWTRFSTHSYDYSNSLCATLHLEWSEPTPPPSGEAYELDELRDAIENVGFDDNTKVALATGRTADSKYQYIQVDSDGKVVIAG